MEHILVFTTLFLTLILFTWGRVRHDFVALIALLFLVSAGIITPERAFSGFSHPAVITVAAVLVIGRALEFSGLIDLLGKWVMGISRKKTVQIISLSVLVAVASAFMNNVGALAVMMPVAIQMARKSGYSPSLILMPLAFASLLGGMTTLIGTPPNIIIATFRADKAGEAFGMFSFSPVGIGVAVCGVLFITLAGRFLLPKRSGKKSKDEAFDIDDYITEVTFKKNARVKDTTIADLKKKSKADVQILGLVRNKRRMHAPDDREKLQSKDVIILETDAEELKTFLDNTGMELVGGKQFRKDATGSKDIEHAEAVVSGDSPLLGKTAAGMHLRSAYGINLLAVSRRGTKIRRRIDSVTFHAGDVLLLQGRAHMIDDIIATLGCLPLAPRSLRLGYRKRISLSLGIFIVSITLVVSGTLPVQASFSMAALAMVLTGMIHPKEVYDSIDWSVIILLGAMIPVGKALEATGGANLIASQILHLGGQFPVWAILTIVLIVTMFLSDIINNAATVVLMAPISISVASGLGASLDPFLMAVAVGGSCAFLTPIGHQSNTLVMGPGGYRFGDYWRLGLPLEIIIVLAGVPLILYFWPV